MRAACPGTPSSEPPLTGPLLSTALPSPPPCSVLPSFLGLDDTDSDKRTVIEDAQGSISSLTVGDKMEDYFPEPEKK